MYRNLSTLVLLASLAAAPALAQTNDATADPHAMHHAGTMPMSSMVMPSAFGPYEMTREGSGTAWQPEATPMGGMMIHGEQWTTMIQGFANVTYDHQGGPRRHGVARPRRDHLPGMRAGGHPVDPGRRHPDDHP